MAVLSDDILSIDPQRIKDISVEMTIVGGKIVYKKDSGDLVAHHLLGPLLSWIRYHRSDLDFRAEIASRFRPR